VSKKRSVRKKTISKKRLQMQIKDLAAQRANQVRGGNVRPNRRIIPCF